MAKLKHTAAKSASKKPSKLTALPSDRTSSPRTQGRKEGTCTPGGQVLGGRVGKPRRYRPGTVALREIRHFQKTTKLLIPAASLVRNVKALTSYYSTWVTRWTAEAVTALQEAAEDYIIRLFEDGILCAIHARRIALMKKDFELARRLKGIGGAW